MLHDGAPDGGNGAGYDPWQGLGSPIAEPCRPAMADHRTRKVSRARAVSRQDASSASTSACRAGSPQATTEPPSSQRPPPHVVIDAARLGHDRHQRLHVVGIERCFDHDVDQSHREEAIRVAIAAPSGQARAVGHPVECGALAGGAEHLGIGAGDDGVAERRAAPGLATCAARRRDAIRPRRPPSPGTIRRRTAGARPRRRRRRRHGARSASPSASGRG